MVRKSCQKNSKKTKAVLESGLGISKPATEYNQSNDIQQRKRNDTVNHPTHYNYGEIETIDFIEQVTQHYNPNVAYHIGNAIKYLARSPHKNGKEDVSNGDYERGQLSKHKEVLKYMDLLDNTNEFSNLLSDLGDE